MDKLNNWLFKYNSDIFFKGFVNKYKNLNIKKVNKNLNLNTDLKNNINTIKKICLKKKCDTSFIVNNLILLTKLTRLEIIINNYLKNFFSNINDLKILIIYSENSFIYKQFLKYKKIKKENIKSIYLKNNNEINDIKINDDYNIICINYKENFKENLKILYNILSNINNNIIILTFNLTISNFIKDFLVLINNYCTVYFILDYRYCEIQWLNTRIILSDFWKINELKQKIKEILNLDLVSDNDGFLNEDINNYDIIKYYDKMTKFIYHRYINFYEIFKGRELIEKEKKMIINHNLQGIIRQNIPINPSRIPWLLSTLTTKIMDIGYKKIKLHSGINFPEAQFLYKTILKNKFKNILEVGMAYGMSALFMTFALKKLHIEKKLEKGLLISIDPFQTKQWNKVGLYNIKKAKNQDYHKLIEKTSEEAMPDILKTYKRKMDLIFIDGFHTFDYTLVDVYYALRLLKINGLLIIDDIKHPGVAKVGKYIDTNFDFLKKIDAPKTFGAYMLYKEDNREWDFHRDF